MKFIVVLSSIFSVVLLPLSAVADDHFEINAVDRAAMGMTVYNGNFAVITDQRKVVVPRGELRLEIGDVARTIEPQTVSIISDEKKGFVASHQNYRYDLLNRESLLERFVGRKVKYSRSLLENGTFETVLREGILLSINPEIVMFGDVIEIQPEGTISLPSIPSDLRTTPTLVFLGENQREGEQIVSVRYHAANIGWEADYSLFFDKESSLTGWVTVRNQSDTDFEIDELRLIAGDINRVAPAPMVRRTAMMAEMAADAGNAKRSEGGDYHRYDFPGPVNLLKHDMTQLQLVSATGIQTEKSYRLVSHVQRYVNEAQEERSPAIVLTFSNSKRNNLDLPLPAGRVRVYDKQGSVESFIGEARIGHKAAGSDIELEIGNAFDISSQRVQTQYRRLADRSIEVGYRIELKNASDKKVDVILEEKLFGDWQVIDRSDRSVKKDSQTLVFEKRVPAKGSVTVSYVVRVDW